MVWKISQRHASHWFHWDKRKFLCLWAFPRTRELQTLTHTNPTEIVLPCFWQIPKFWAYVAQIRWWDLYFRLTVSSINQCRSLCCILKGGEQSQDKRSPWPISHDNFYTTERGFQHHTWLPLNHQFKWHCVLFSAQEKWQGNRPGETQTQASGKIPEELNQPISTAH